MSSNKNQALWTAVILHLVVMFALFLGIIIEAFEPKEKLHVFQMVEPPSEDASQEYSPPVDVVLPEIAEFDLTDVPDFAAVPEPVSPPATPAPPRQVKPAPLMSAKDFFETNPLKAPRPRPTPAPTPRPRVEIKTQKFTVPDTFVPSASTQNMSPREQDAMRRYVAQISALLNRAWIKPGSLAGRDLRVTAIFYVDSAGRISQIRFQPGSGNAAFDTSVRAAFSKIRGAGPTPSGSGQEIRISFTMLD